MKIVLAFTALLFAAPAFAAAPSPLRKVATYHLKQPRYGAAAVSEGRYVYVIAGCDAGEFFGDIVRFDTVSGEMRELTRALNPRRYLSAEIVGQRIYIFGGWGDTGTDRHPDDSVEIFDLTTGRISRGAPVPTPRAHVATAVHRGEIYTFGGQTAITNTHPRASCVEIYDPAANRWRTGPSMPTARETRATAVGQFLLVPAGFNGITALPTVEFLDPATGLWKTLPELSHRMSAHSLAFLGEHLFLFGNYGREGEVVAYHLKTRHSQLIDPGYKPARHTCAVVNGGRIYVIGGYANTDGYGFDDIQVFAPATSAP